MRDRSHVGWPYLILGLTFFLSTMPAPFVWRGEEARQGIPAAFPKRSEHASAKPVVSPARPAMLDESPIAIEVAANQAPPEPTEESVALAQPDPPAKPSRTAMAQESIALDPSIDDGSASGISSAEPRASATIPRAPSASDPPPQAAQQPLSPVVSPPADASPPRGRAWPVAEALEEQLAALGDKVPLARSWADRLLIELKELSLVAELAHPSAATYLDRLDRLTADARQQANRPERSEGRSLVLRTCYAVQRRVDIWKAVYALETSRQAAVPIVARGQVEQSLHGAVKVLKQNPEEAGWASYLMLAEAGKLLPRFPEKKAECQQLARTMLRRIHSPQLEIRQELLLKQPEIVHLENVLRQIAVQSIDRVSLLAALEKFEAHPLSHEAATVAEAFDRLRWSTSPADVDLSNRLGTYYRNANVRVALTEELVNRLLPKDQFSRDAVSDNILGADVQGETATHAQVTLTLVPDRERWRLGVVANGHVTSSTASSKGPATFYQDGFSRFHARKLLLIDRGGVRLYRAEAEASASTELRDYETGFDSIPVIGSIARAIVRNSYDEQVSWAQGEVENRIRTEASNRLDEEVRKQVEAAQKEVYAKLIDPLNNLRLEPTAVEFETTAERLIARYRVAGVEQLAAYTPRPQAPAGSLLSVQIHQTSFNNLLGHLNLNGRRTDLRALYEEMAKQFQAKDTAIPEDLPEGVTVQFADHDAVRLDCIDGRVRVTIRLAELSQGSRKWKNFAARAYYKPTADQLNANLVRDGIIELPEGRLTTGDQIALRGVFSKVLSKNRPFNLINNRIADAPALKGLKVTQFAIDDGWMAIAIGKPQVISAQAPRPSAR